MDLSSAELAEGMEGNTDLCWSGARVYKDTGITNSQIQVGLAFNELMQPVFSKGSHQVSVSLMLTPWQHQNLLLITEGKAITGAVQVTTGSGLAQPVKWETAGITHPLRHRITRQIELIPCPARSRSPPITGVSS